MDNVIHMDQVTYSLEDFRNHLSQVTGEHCTSIEMCNEQGMTLMAVWFEVTINYCTHEKMGFCVDIEFDEVFEEYQHIHDLSLTEMLIEFIVHELTRLTCENVTLH